MVIWEPSEPVGCPSGGAEHAARQATARKVASGSFMRSELARRGERACHPKGDGAEGARGVGQRDERGRAGPDGTAAASAALGSGLGGGLSRRRRQRRRGPRRT